jgi:hypothetical protein
MQCACPCSRSTCAANWRESQTRLAARNTHNPRSTLVSHHHRTRTTARAHGQKTRTGQLQQNLGHHLSALHMLGALHFFIYINFNNLDINLNKINK